MLKTQWENVFLPNQSGQLDYLVCKERKKGRDCLRGQHGVHS